MLTNVLLVVFFVVYVTLYILNWYKHRKFSESEQKVFEVVFKNHDSLLINQEKIYKEIKEELKNQGLIMTNTENQVVLINKEYLTRIELQEKLIAELKKTQAPDQVVDTVNLINEWMNGATVEEAKNG